MPRLVVNPDADRVTTRELRNEEITDKTITFDERGVSEQELDADDVDEFVEQYPSLERESNVDDSQIDDVAQLLAGTVDEIREMIETGAYDEQLDAIAQREQAGDGRTTVFGAVERRRDELESDDTDTGADAGAGSGEGS